MNVQELIEKLEYIHAFEEVTVNGETIIDIKINKDGSVEIITKKEEE